MEEEEENMTMMMMGDASQNWRRYGEVSIGSLQNASAGAQSPWEEDVEGDRVSSGQAFSGVFFIESSVDCRFPESYYCAIESALAVVSASRGAGRVRIYSAKCREELQQAVQSKVVESMLSSRRAAAALEIVPLNMTRLSERRS